MLEVEDVLIIFMKYPEPGLVKTRLAKDIGKEKAAWLYRLFVETILNQTNDTSFTRILFYCPKEKKKEFKNWIGNGLLMQHQRGHNLGQRLSNAFKFAFKNKAKRVIAIGTDSPTLDNNIIRKAFKKLKDFPCVLGPSLDGGYYLIGLSRLYLEIFKGIPWGKDDVFRKTQYKIRKLGLKFCLLEPHPDIDTLNDLHRIGRTGKGV